jgi:hypothetical protein
MFYRIIDSSEKGKVFIKTTFQKNIIYGLAWSRILGGINLFSVGIRNVI